MEGWNYVILFAYFINTCFLKIILDLINGEISWSVIIPKHYQKCFPEQFKTLTCHLVKLNLPLQWNQKTIIYLSTEVTFSRQLFVLSFHLFCNHFPIDCLLQQLLKCVIAHFFSWKFIFHSLYLSAFVVIVTSVK